MNQKILYVIRGLPGSGKSSLAASLDLSCPAFEADKYFLNEAGEYVFDYTKLGAAHRQCEEQVATAMRADWPRLAVANTSVLRRDYEAYLTLAVKYGYTVFVIHCENTWPNTHGCPTEKVQQMAGRWEHHDPRFVG